jgi:2,4-didehydro-3-deoxy-L-rhamnonate hydrolase
MKESSTPRYALGTFAANGSERFAGLVVDDHVVDLRPALGTDITTLKVLEDWDRSLVRLEEIAQTPHNGAPALEQLRPCVPAAFGQVLCAGANYTRHVRQMAFAGMRAGGDPRPDDELRAAAVDITNALSTSDPFIFAGLTSALSGANDDIVLWGPGEQHDWELELAVVIGRGGRNIAVQDAMEHVAGYTISNDVSTRDLLVRPPIPMSDLVMSKSRPGFFPTGPYIVPRAAVPDPKQLRVTLSVNGEVMQDESVDDLIHDIDRLVAYASTAAELFPGDLLLTGSPAGNAAHHGNRWLRPGDVIEGHITGLGHQRNQCVAPD